MTLSKLNPFVPTHVLYTNLGTPKEDRVELTEISSDDDESSAFCSAEDWNSGERYSDWGLDSERRLTFQGQAPGPGWGQHKIVLVENDVPQYKKPADYVNNMFLAGYAIVNDQHDGGFVWALGSTLEEIAREWNSEYGPDTGFSDDSPKLDVDELHSGYEVLDGRADNSGVWWVAGLTRGAFESLKQNGERSPATRSNPLVLLEGRYYALYSEVRVRGLTVEEDQHGCLRAV